MKNSKKKTNTKKDNLRRVKVEQQESRRTRFKVIQSNQALPLDKRFLALIKLSRFSQNSSRVRIQNRCVLTGRARGIYRFFKMSRIMIRELAAKGLLPGVKKAS